MFKQKKDLQILIYSSICTYLRLIIVLDGLFIHFTTQKYARYNYVLDISTNARLGISSFIQVDYGAS